MNFDEIIEIANSSVVQILIKNQQGEIISSGTAFFSNNFLISNNHIFFDPDNQPLNGSNVEVRSENKTITISYESLMTSVKLGSDVDNNDYIIFKTDSFTILKPEKTFKFSSDSAKIGDAVVFFGYPFGIERLTTHRGYISAKFNQAGVDKFQIDGSVNPGNSGGPILDLEQGQILALMTRSITGLEQSFEVLTSNLDRNIEVLKTTSGVKISGIDPMQVLALTQEQMKIVAFNLKRSANVGIGIGYSSKKLADEISQNEFSG